MKIFITVLCVLVIGLAVTTVLFYNLNKKTEKSLKDLAETIDNLQARADILDKEKTVIANELAAKIANISKEKEEEIARLKTTYDELVTGMKQEIEEGQIKITRMADRLSVSMVDRILFPSGEAEITPAGLKVLERVGKVLKNTRDKVIRVEGHTDNVSIKPLLQKQFPTNWELSAARATNVVRFLQERIGVDPKRLQAIGMSEYHPVASNATASGQSLNRRIEINLVPETAK